MCKILQNFLRWPNTPSPSSSFSLGTTSLSSSAYSSSFRRSSSSQMEFMELEWGGDRHDPDRFGPPPPDTGDTAILFLGTVATGNGKKMNLNATRWWVPRIAMILHPPSAGFTNHCSYAASKQSSTFIDSSWICVYFLILLSFILLICLSCSSCAQNKDNVVSGPHCYFSLLFPKLMWFDFDIYLARSLIEIIDNLAGQFNSSILILKWSSIRLSEWHQSIAKKTMMLKEFWFDLIWFDLI